MRLESRRQTGSYWTSGAEPVRSEEHHNADGVFDGFNFPRRGPRYGRALVGLIGCCSPMVGIVWRHVAAAVSRNDSKNLESDLPVSSVAVNFGHHHHR